jgi:heptosyltransferase-2
MLEPQPMPGAWSLEPGAVSEVRRLIVFAPNWLGDAVMAVPCVNAIRRHYPSAALAVAARSHLAPLFEMVNGVDEVVCLEPAGRLGGWLSALRDARRLRAARFDIAILLPNSFRAAWIARRARITERWGYAADGRTQMLTRAVPRLRGGHQVEYYRRLLEGLGIMGSGAITELKSLPTSLQVPGDAREWARGMLASQGWKAAETLVGMAPGAAYGTAKQWPPERFAQLAIEMGPGVIFAQKSLPVPESFFGVRTVLVGSTGDRATCDAIARIVAAHVASMACDRGVINLSGATDLRQLAGIMAECRTFVSNDSGAMHLAAAVGVPVVAIFGPTNEKETGPLPLRPGTRDHGPGIRDQGSGIGAEHAIIAADVWCRPCMLRECPLDHACMTGIDVARVKAEVMKQVEGGTGRDQGSGIGE